MAMPVRARLDDILVKISWPSKSGMGVSETRRPQKELDYHYIYIHA